VKIAKTFLVAGLGLTPMDGAEPFPGMPEEVRKAKSKSPASNSAEPLTGAGVARSLTPAEAVQSLIKSENLIDGPRNESVSLAVHNGEKVLVVAGPIGGMSLRTRVFEGRVGQKLRELPGNWYFYKQHCGPNSRAWLENPSGKVGRAIVRRDDRQFRPWMASPRRALLGNEKPRPTPLNPTCSRVLHPNKRQETRIRSRRP
jgi:hypothetical protein